jgi:beta-galactosidase
LAAWLLLAALLGIASNSAFSATRFRREFSPSEPYVSSPEAKFRHDICLNGSWRFQPVELPADFREGIDPVPQLTLPKDSGWEETPVKIPSPWNVNSFADHHGEGGDFRTYPSYPKAWEKIEMGWLRRHISVPSTWSGGRILLHFNAAAGDIQVLVNGRDAGHRFDLFFPFEVDVTDLIKAGADNEILVGIRKASLFDVKGRYGRRTYQGGSFWGQHIVGIWQDVDLLYVPSVSVSNVFVQPIVNKSLLRVAVTVRNDSPASVDTRIGGDAFRWVSLAPREGVEAAEPRWTLDGKPAIQMDPVMVSIPAHESRTVTLETKVGSALELWAPEHPALYGLLVDLEKDGHPVDRKYQRFGWRQIELDGSKILLNGQAITIKGDSWHFLGVPQMTRRYAWGWFTALHDAHLNAVRLHAEPYPEFYLDVADEMGIMVLDETAIWASDGGPKLDSDAFWDDTRDHVAQLVERDRNHPSVFGWSVCNEVKPIVQGVFQGPPEMLHKLTDYYAIWAQICRKLDPTRQWISADGDGDGLGTLPVNMLHYAGPESMAKAAKLGKPWGVGEASGAYYATPEQVSTTYGDQAYKSVESRMEGIAVEAYRNLVSQREAGAGYRSVFNLIWYGLKPLPLGMADTSRPPSLQDGVFFSEFVEGRPGVQPERLGPYSTTLNPGYDSALNLYETWPLFDAIKDANSEPLVAFPLTRVQDDPKHGRPSATTEIRGGISIVSGEKSTLEPQLRSAGIRSEDLHDNGVPEILFVDGKTPPDPAAARSTMEKVLKAGGKVVVWGIAQDTLSKLNALLPAPLELTPRTATSLVPDPTDPLTADFRFADLYFSELHLPLISSGGLDGPLVQRSKVLLRASDTDWTKWNNQPEFAKTGMVLRSELESKPSGAALIEVSEAAGKLYVVNLPVWSHDFKVQSMIRHLLANFGLNLQPQVDVGEPFLKTGDLVRSLAIGGFSASGAGLTKALVDPKSGNSFRESNRVGDLRWIRLSAGDEGLNLSAAPLSSHPDQSVVYLSFWVTSPRSLDNLLLEPNLPKLDLSLDTKDSVEVFLNGRSVPTHSGTGGEITASGLPLQQGHNHFLLRVVHGNGNHLFKAKLLCSDAAFLHELSSSVQAP